MDTAQSDPARQQLDDFLQFVRDARGFDFTGYKSSTVERRVALRMNDVGVTTYDEYIDYLELHGDEYEALFNSILINVTGFFRDGPAWDYLVTDLLPGLIAGAASGSAAPSVVSRLRQRRGGVQPRHGPRPRSRR